MIKIIEFQIYWQRMKQTRYKYAEEGTQSNFFSVNHSEFFPKPIREEIANLANRRRLQPNGTHPVTFTEKLVII